MRKILTIPDELLEKIEHYQHKVFYHQFTSSTITTLIALGIKYLEEGREIIQQSTPYFIPQPQPYYQETGQRKYKEEENHEPK